MQFVFGDNTSKYTMLYFDDKPDAAEKAQSLVQMSYSPNPDFESVGFVPFGANNTRALFFKFCKDFKMKRNVYFLHGVYSDVEPEYFYGKNYVYGLFTQFLDQEKFDVLRDQVLAGEKGDVPYAFNKALAETPDDQIYIEGADLHTILTKLYQRKNVVMVMDDDKFSNDRAVLIVKKIFHYLPPSLRKLCSYVTAVDDTGSMDFMLRIIPRSMLKLKEEHVDLDNESPLMKDKSNFPQIAATLMAMNGQERENLFTLYEKLYYGRDSIYKKQNFEGFYLCYTGGSEDEESRKLCDELLTDYLDNPKLPQNPEIPQFLQDALASRYASEQVLDMLVDWNIRNLENMDKFCDINGDVMRKVYYLCDPKLTYFRNKINEMFYHSYTSADIEELTKFYNNTLVSAKAMTDVQAHEGAFMMIISDILKYLGKITKGYSGVKDQAKACAEEYLYQNCKTGAGEPRAVLQQVLNVVGDQVAQLRPLVLDIDEEIKNFVVHQIVSPYNTRCNELARERRAQRDRDMKNNIYAAYVQRLKMDSDGGAEGMDMDVSVEYLTGEDLDLVAEDDELCQNLAHQIAEYIVGVCALRNKGDFKYNHNENLKLARNMKLCFQVAKSLCRKNAVDYAVLYLMAYMPRSDAAVKYILQMNELDALDGRGLSNLKNLLPDLLNRRRKVDRLEREELKELDAKAREVLEDKSASKPRRVVATMFHDMVVGGPTILERERKRNVMIGICAGVGALLLIGALVLVIILGGGKDDKTDSTKDPGSTTVTDPTDPPACSEHTYGEGVETTKATCTEAGVKTFTCSVCGESYTEEIAPLGHTYENGACKDCEELCPGHTYKGGVCGICGLKCEEHTFAVPEGGEKSVCSVCNLCEAHEDGDWNDPTCTEPKTCKFCGLTDDEVPALGHDWTDATCTEAKTCSRCNTTEGEALGHDWAEATCIAPKTCSVCGTTEGEALGHAWDDATCTEPKTCSVCGLTDEEAPALGHVWTDATCTAPKTCSVCGTTEGEALGHKSQESNYVAHSCKEEVIKVLTCERGDTYEDFAPADGHTLDDDGKCIDCNADDENDPTDPTE